MIDRRYLSIKNKLGYGSGDIAGNAYTTLPAMSPEP